MSNATPNLNEISIDDNLLVSSSDLQEAKNSNQELEDHLGIARVERFKTDTLLRKKLVGWFTIIIAGWLLATIGILYFFLLANCKNKLSDTVLVTLLTTTTINVIGMMLIILKDLFPKSNFDEKKTTAKAT